MAERQLPKLNVAGSIPVSRSKFVRDADLSTHQTLRRRVRRSTKRYLIAAGGIFMAQPLQWMKADRPMLGTVLTIDHPVTIEIAADAGFDWLWIDAEHGRFNENSAANACAMTRGRVPTLVRTPDHSETSLKRYLDAGADGIIVPQVSSLEECRAIARAALYPPLGRRSVGIARAQGYGAGFADAVRERSYAIVVQIETLAGVRAAHEIVQEPYIDAVIIGPYDLSGSCGVPGDIACAEVQDAIAAVLSICKRAGKSCGIFAGDAEAGAAYAQQGFDLIGLSMDVQILLNGYSAMRQSFQQAAKPTLR